MKKLVAVFLVLTMSTSLILTGCGKEEVSQDINQKQENKVEQKDETEKKSGEIAVDKNLLTVDLTLPPTLVGDINDFNEKEYLAENEGIKAVKVNEDGSITLTMTKKKHKELMDEMSKEIETSIDELIESEDTPYI